MLRVSEKYPVGIEVGQRDCGKTTYMVGSPELNMAGYVQEKCLSSNLKGVIVIDTQRERETYKDVRKITHPEQYVSGAVHLIVTPENADEYVNWIRLNVTDTFILFEDARLILPSRISKTPYEALVIDSKNIRCTVWFMYHTWMAVPKELYGLLDLIEVFKVKQHPQVRKMDITNYEEVLEVYEKVLKSKNPFFHQTVKNGA